MIDPISEFKAGMFINKQFIVEKMDIREGKNAPFLLFIVKDDSAQLRAVYFNGFERGIEKKITKGSIVEISGKVNVNNGEHSIVIEKFKVIENSEEIIPNHFIDSYDNLDEHWVKLEGYIESIKDKELKELLKLIFSDSEIKEKFKIYPAAKSMHHIKLGGLLVHTLEVVDLCENSAKVFGKIVNRDLLIAGGMLHDLGKIEEFEIENGREYSEKGKLMSHLVIAPILLNSFFAKMDYISERKKNILIHLIISHHGRYEYKSPELPKTKEAFILNMCDDMSAKIDTLEIIKNSLPKNKDWSNYNTLLDRNLFFGNI